MEVFIVDIAKSNSKHHTGMIYDITFMDFKGNVYNSYVDPKNRNYDNWSYIIKAHFRNNSGFILNNVNVRAKDKTQIDAASNPIITTETTDRDAMLDIINEEIMYDPRRAIFGRLFNLG